LRQAIIKYVRSDLLVLIMIGGFAGVAVVVFQVFRDPVLERYDPNKIVMPTWPISEDQYKQLLDPAAPGPMREGSGEVRDPEWNRLRKGKQTVDSMPRNPDGTPKTN